jgi:hypothetical protein
MTSSPASLGACLWTDGATYSALRLRQFWGGTKVFDQGTVSAVSPAGGVYAGAYPSPEAMMVTAPVSGLTVNVSAGYCSVPNSVSGDGTYIFGLMASGSLVVATASGANPRIDLVCANVQDTGSGAFAQVEILTGTATTGATLTNLTGAPALPSSSTSSSIALAYVLVPTSAANIVSGDIGDHRTFVAPPGCVPPISAATAAPAVPATQIMYNAGTGTLVQGTGTAGTVGSLGFTGVGGYQVINTSTGGEGQSPGTPSSDPWGIGTGEIGGHGGGKGGGANDTDGIYSTQMSVTFTADGTSDYEVFYKWQLCMTAQAFAGVTDTQTNCGVTLGIFLDGSHVDSVSLMCADDPLGTSGGGSASWYTSATLGTTPNAGPHTAELAVLTSSTYSATGPVSGVFIGDVNDSGGTIFGAGSTYLNALVAENAALRVIQVPVA